MQNKITKKDRRRVFLSTTINIKATTIIIIIIIIIIIMTIIVVVVVVVVLKVIIITMEFRVKEMEMEKIITNALSLQDQSSTW